jgi:hypothetical protein
MSAVIGLNATPSDETGMHGKEVVYGLVGEAGSMTAALRFELPFMPAHTELSTGRPDLRW